MGSLQKKTIVTKRARIHVSKKRGFIALINNMLDRLFRLRVSSIYKRKMRESERCLAVLGKPPSYEQIQIYEQYWKRFGLRADPVCLKYYMRVSGIFDTRYVPNDLFYTRIERVLNNPNDAFHYANKNLLDRNFEPTLFPKTLLRYFLGAFYDSDYQELHPHKALAALGEIDEPFVKKISEESCGGHGVSFHELADSDSMARRGETLPEILNESRPFLIQRRITQSDFARRFHPGSVNTFRVVTLRRPISGEVVVLKRILRMGVNACQVDNQSSGGISVGVFDCGRLNAIAYDSSGRAYSFHPTSKVAFANKRFAAVRELDNFAIGFNRFTPTLRLLALDIAQQEDETFVCLEVNTYGMQIDFLQTYDGGLFAEYTDEVMTYCLENATSASFRYVRGFYF